MRAFRTGVGKGKAGRNTAAYEALFDAYKEADSTDETIGPEGIEQLCGAHRPAIGSGTGARQR